MDAEGKKKRTPRPEKISLSQDALKKVNAWFESISDQLKGTKISRSDLVSWFVETQENELTKDSIKEIERKYFDQVKFGHWAIAEYKSAVARGETTTLAEIVSKNQPISIKKSKPSKPRVKRGSETKSEATFTQSTANSEAALVEKIKVLSAKK